jgi:hypothetical protein
MCHKRAIVQSCVDYSFFEKVELPMPKREVVEGIDSGFFDVGEESLSVVHVLTFFLSARNVSLRYSLCCM